MFVPQTPLIRLAEPLLDSKLTKNGMLELERNNCLIPEYEVDERILGFYDNEAQIGRDSKTPKMVSLEDVGIYDSN